MLVYDTGRSLFNSLPRTEIRIHLYVFVLQKDTKDETSLISYAKLVQQDPSHA